MPAKQRLAFAAVAVLIAVVAVVFLAGSGGSSAEEEAQEPPRTPEAAIPQEPEAEPARTATPAPEAQPEVARIRIRGGEPAGGVQEVRVEEGERIRFTVTSDVVDHVHLHGYDVVRDVGPGRPAAFDVEATITGVFEAELEDRGVPIAEVRVEP